MTSGLTSLIHPNIFLIFTGPRTIAFEYPTASACNPGTSIIHQRVFEAFKTHVPRPISRQANIRSAKDQLPLPIGTLEGLELPKNGGFYDSVMAGLNLTWEVSKSGKTSDKLINNILYLYIPNLSTPNRRISMDFSHFSHGVLIELLTQAGHPRCMPFQDSQACSAHEVLTEFRSQALNGNWSLPWLSGNEWKMTCWPPFFDFFWLTLKEKRPCLVDWKPLENAMTFGNRTHDTVATSPVPDAQRGVIRAGDANHLLEVLALFFSSWWVSAGWPHCPM